MLKHPLAGDELDSAPVTLQRTDIIRSKPFLYKLYCQWYRQIADALPDDAAGPVLELGAGAGFMQEFIPGLVTSELLDTRQVDVTLDGCQLPIKDRGLSAIVMIDVFHHLPDVAQFLGESARCVQPGGSVIMIEPWITAWSHLVYRYLHHEPVDLDIPCWQLPEGGPLSTANSALPWIVFSRDAKRFEVEFPQWQLKKMVLHTPFGYLFSGGVSYRSFAPGALFSACCRLEQSLAPFMSRLAMFATISLERAGC